jgi:hypothetical protein
MLAQLYHKLRNVTVGPGLELANTRMGMHFSLREKPTTRGVPSGPTLGTQISFVIITEVPETGDILTVQSVKRSGYHSYETVGDPFEAYVWPGFETREYTQLRTANMIYAKVVPLVTVEGDRYVIQQFRFDTVLPSGSLERGDCRLR